MLSIHQLVEHRGHQLLDANGTNIGKITQVYEDRETGQPEWVTVNTGLFGSQTSFVPIADAHIDGGELRVPFDKDKVKNAPRIDDDGELSEQEEAELYRYYDQQYGKTASGSGLPEENKDETRDAHDRAPVGRDVSGPTTDDAMTRSEEELRVGTEQREAGRARLRKYVVTEEVQKTVPVQREEVRVEREPITEANVGDATSGPTISDEEHEVVLHQ
jgi:stress response protein YsnF